MPSPQDEYRQHTVHCNTCHYVDLRIPHRSRCEEGARLFALLVQEDIAKGHRLPNGDIRVILLPQTKEDA